jgi:capsular exopolysaccharide synthesis family protein
METSADVGIAPGLSTDRAVDIRYYANLLWRGRLIVITTAILGLLLGLLVAFMQTPEYRAATTIQIDPPVPLFMNVTDALIGGGNYWQNADFYNTQYKILRSNTLCAKVVEELKLGDRPPFKGAVDLGGMFANHVGVAPIPETRLVLVSVTHTDPKDAALWANTLADVYLNTSVSNRVESAVRANEWLQGRMATTQKNMRESYEKYLKMLQSQDLVAVEGSVSSVSSSIARLNEDHVAAQARRIEIESALKQIVDMRQRGQSLDTVPQIVADQQITQLEGQLSSLSIEQDQLKEKYKPAHPEMQRFLRRVEQVRRAKAARVLQIVQAMETELKQTEKREMELRAAIDEQKNQAATQSKRITELEVLKKEAESARGLVDVLIQKLNETDIAASIRNNNVAIIERAIPPRRPVRPNKPRIALLGLLLGTGLGIALILGRDFLDHTLKDPEDVERFLHIDLLAVVPKYNEPGAPAVIEAYQSVRTALLFARKEPTGQIVLVTGTIPQEGKTTTVANLAKLMASSGDRTVILDLDLRRAQLHHRLGVPREPGLTDIFVHHADVDDVVQSTRVPNLYVLTAGPLPPNPPALLARKALGDMLERLRKHFVWILIDSPPLASVTDALLIARLADAVLMVTQHNKVDKKLVKRQVAALRKATPNVLGVILNAMDVKTKGYYYYHQYYYSHDHETPPGQTPKAPESARKQR